MMFRILFLVFFTHLSLADNITNGTYKEMFENGLPKYGKEIFWFDSGVKKMESHYIQGIESGHWRQWHKNGVIKLEVNYINGKKNGLWQQWFTNEKLRSSVKFIDGAKHGKELMFSPNGSIISEEYYINGKVVE